MMPFEIVVWLDDIKLTLKVKWACEILYTNLHSILLRWEINKVYSQQTVNACNRMLYMNLSRKIWRINNACKITHKDSITCVLEWFIAESFRTPFTVSFLAVIDCKLPKIAKNAVYKFPNLLLGRIRGMRLAWSVNYCIFIQMWAKTIDKWEIILTVSVTTKCNLILISNWQ